VSGAQLSLLTGKTVHSIVSAAVDELFELVRQTYLLHDAGMTVNPPRQLLRFPDTPEARIISLAASVRSGSRATGMKWISSFPKNTKTGLPRASAILALNDPDNGYPYAVMESSIISATRTAISAVVAAEALENGARDVEGVAFIGGGLIARHVLDVLRSRRWKLGAACVYDADPASAARFARYCIDVGIPARCVPDVRQALNACDLIVFATTALEQHVSDATLFSHNPTVLHLSQRDLGPPVIAASQNFVDDSGHAFSAMTSLQLTEKQCGHRGFLAGTIADLLQGRCDLLRCKPRVFSPFGLGVLDVAVGRMVYEKAMERGDAIAIANFFDATAVW
jgi:N-[(2S)-2-amino-2-carboxyethyl]-L-glutamate dehydrogenase